MSEREQSLIDCPKCGRSFDSKKSRDVFDIDFILEEGWCSRCEHVNADSLGQDIFDAIVGGQQIATRYK